MGQSEIEFSDIDLINPNNSKPIGECDNWTQITLTSIVKNNNDWWYGEEIPAEKLQGGTQSKFLLGNSKDSRWETITWNRTRIRLSRKSAKEKYKMPILSVAELPYRMGVAFHTPFRKSNRKGGQHDKLPTYFQSVMEYINAYEKLPYEPEETGDYLTASFSFIPNEVSGIERNCWLKGWKTRYGICDNPSQVWRDLFFHARSRDLVDLTLNDELLFGHPPNKYSVESPVKNIAEDILSWSIYQAMAGLSSNEDRGCIIDAVDRIYRNHIGRMNRNDAYKSSDALDRKEFSFDDAIDSILTAEDRDKITSIPSLADLLDEFQLLLIDSNVTNLPDEAESTVTLARTNRGLFLRIQNADGEKVIDEYLQNLVREEESSRVLSADVSKLIDANCSPTSEEKVSLLNRIAEILP